ncbi:MAG: hypothetical protein FWG88_03490 [Oscillospiraceae bacterium]|nr:hypothetical protein [Oscillospiraceae bacterium]
MEIKYKCPMLNTKIDETICYDIQMVVGSGNLINKNILNYYKDIFDPKIVTDEASQKHCVDCPFNQLYGQTTKISTISEKKI